MKTYRVLKPFPHGNGVAAIGAMLRLTAKQALFLANGGFVAEGSAARASSGESSATAAKGKK
jgi:hypothetical protein